MDWLRRLRRSRQKGTAGGRQGPVAVVGATPSASSRPAGDKSDGFVGHLEATLGPIAEGYRLDKDQGFSVVRFPGAPGPGTTTLCTLGISHHVLHQPNGEVCEELLLIAHDVCLPPSLVGLLTAVGVQLLANHTALLQGEVIDLGGPIAAGSALTALYAALPVVYPDEFFAYEATTPPIVVVWLVPITAGEAELVATHGWPWFEDQLAEQQPDLFDLNRAAIRHGPPVSS